MAIFLPGSLILVYNIIPL